MAQLAEFTINVTFNDSRSKNMIGLRNNFSKLLAKKPKQSKSKRSMKETDVKFTQEPKEVKKATKKKR